MPGPISLDTTAGPPVEVGATRLKLEAQVLTLRLPFGGCAWQRPTAVLVEHGGETQRLRILDVTRLAQAALLGLAFATAAAGRNMRGYKESSHGQHTPRGRSRA